VPKSSKCAAGQRDPKRTAKPGAGARPRDLKRHRGPDPSIARGCPTMKPAFAGTSAEKRVWISLESRRLRSKAHQVCSRDGVWGTEDEVNFARKR
jgi:hypothetical protein